jgi:hypothetical protein
MPTKPPGRDSSRKPSPVQRCYEAFVHRTDSCETCPAIKVFHAPNEDKSGKVMSMLVLFKAPARPSPFPTTGRDAQRCAPSLQPIVVIGQAPSRPEHKSAWFDYFTG